MLLVFFLLLGREFGDGLLIGDLFRGPALLVDDVMRPSAERGQEGRDDENEPELFHLSGGAVQAAVSGIPAP